MTNIITLLLALIIDRLVGWPDALFRRLSHPVVAIGRVISWHDRYLNRPQHSAIRRRFYGVITVLNVSALALIVAGIPSYIITDPFYEICVTALLAWPLLAAKSLHDHVAAIAKPLAADDVEGARYAVSLIVGRNAAELDKPAIARASLESLAENTSDGVIAPLLWGMVFGLPGLIFYKAVNTMDSMIGYRNERYHAFGWAAARLDDIANYIPARLTALLYMLSSSRPIYSLHMTMRDAAKHRSPNAGWPETAFAAALHIRLSGPRIYDGKPSQDAWLHPEGADPDAADIMSGLHLYRTLLNWVLLLSASVVIVFWLTGIGWL